MSYLVNFAKGGGLIILHKCAVHIYEGLLCTHVNIFNDPIIIADNFRAYFCILEI